MISPSSPPRPEPDPDPPDSEPSYGAVGGVAHIARLSVPRILGGVLDGRIRSQRIRGSLYVAVEDALMLAAEAAGAATSPTLLNDRIAPGDVPGGKPGQAHTGPAGHHTGRPTRTRKGTAMKVSEMYPSKWLRASDVEDGDLVLTIREVRQEEIGQGSQTDEKWVVYFEEEEKGLVLNKTNTNTIAKLYGNDTEDWIGQPITLFATEVSFQGDMVEALRVRSKPPRQRPPAPRKPAPATNEAEAENHPF
jgi:hypothetical protein